MPPKRRPYKTKKPKPVFFGPEPPPPPEPPKPAATGEPGSAASEQLVPATSEAEGHRRRKKKLPRKKINKDSQGGWEDDHVERDPQPEDEGRYDQTVPWDLRLLRCCDEFRSLRTLRHFDRKVNYDAVLRYFQANINRLRSKYGRQPLRGYDPDEGLDDEDAEDEQQDDDDDDGKAAEDVEGAKIEEIVERTEEDWASTVFALGRLAKFFDNRANDNYTSTLWLAPQTMKSFLRFMLARDVFTSYKKQINACIGLCELAGKQLYPANQLFKQLVRESQLVPAVKYLFPSLDSTLASPVEVVPDRKPEPLDPLPDVFSSVSIMGEDDDSESGSDGDEPVSQHEPVDVPSWADSKTAKKEPKEPLSPEDATLARVERIKEQLERDAQTLKAWEDTSAHEAISSSGVFRDALARFGGSNFVVDEQGTWRIGHRERSARSLVAWKVLSQAGEVGRSAAGGHESDPEVKPTQLERTIVQLDLGPHEAAFPVTEWHRSPPLSTTDAIEALEPNSAVLSHSLTSRVSVVVDLAATFDLSRLESLVSALFEADLKQLVFVPSPAFVFDPPLDSAHTPVETPETLWMVDAVHRILPAYWPHAGELLRDEPGKQLSFPGGDYGAVAHAALVKIVEEEEAELLAANQEMQEPARGAEDDGQRFTEVDDEGVAVATV